MSHELRTPLNSLLILARLLADNPNENLSPKQVEYANVIHSSGTDLLQLINDILDLSRVEAGKMELHPERFGLRPLLDDLRAVFQPLTSEKGLTFIATTYGDLPAGCYRPAAAPADPAQLPSNAVKFTEQGRVELRITANHGRTSRAGAGVPVTDTGIGIGEQNLDAIFGAFNGPTARPAAATADRAGPDLCRELAAQLGGRITVQSAVGEGSTFTLHP
jgi:signal transduction histidine kinase